jgi:anthranilate phosphoribosyltransferase
MTSLQELGGWPALISPLMRRENLPQSHTRAAMAEMLTGNATSAQIAGFAVSLRAKGETVEELLGLLEAMLSAAALVSLPEATAAAATDIVGTGGDRSHSINVSTISMFVLAGCGVPVVKHGNRAASSSCGAADLLEALGVRIDLRPDQVAACVAEAGFAFCLAPSFHPSLRHVGPTRRELGVQTSFNILGPMANPAQVSRLVVGVADGGMAERMLQVFARRKARHVLIVHGDDGLDELTTTATSTVWELRDGETRQFSVDPAQFGLPMVEAEALRGGLPARNAELALGVLQGELGPHRDIIALNAGAGLYVAGLVGSIAEGVQRAAATLDEGLAQSALQRLIATTNRLANS